MGALILFHLALLIHYLYGIYVYIYGIKPPPEMLAIRSSFGGLFKYLTFINMLLQCAYFSLAFADDLFSSNDGRSKKRLLTRIKDFVFTTLVFPVGVLVSVTFWSLWHINRELIFPKIFDSFFPVWLNHNIHTMPFIGGLFEIFLSSHTYPSRHVGFFTVSLAATLYCLWICLIAYKTGYWVYPVLEKLPIIGRAAFIVGSAFLAYFFYILGEILNTRRWGVREQRKPKKIS